MAAARMLVGNTIPLLGINLGTLGFLADVNLADLSKTLDLLLKDQYQVENRIMLTAEVYKQGKKRQHISLSTTLILTVVELRELSV